MGLSNVVASMDLNKIMHDSVDGFEGHLIGSNEAFNLYVEILIINEFKFLKLFVIGPLKVETIEGCQVTFVSIEGELNMESDSMEIETVYSKKLKLGITDFDIDLEDELIDMVENQSMKSMQIEIKKSNLEFQIINQELLQEIIKIEE